MNHDQLIPFSPTAYEVQGQVMCSVCLFTVGAGGTPASGPRSFPGGVPPILVTCSVPGLAVGKGNGEYPSQVQGVPPAGQGYPLGEGTAGERVMLRRGRYASCSDAGGLSSLSYTFVIKSVVDPGFPRGRGANPQGEGANLLFSQNFPKNCMKMKEFGPGGGVPSVPP